MTKPAPAPQPAFEHPLLQAPSFLLNWPSWAAWAAPTKRPLDLRRNLAGASVTDADTWAPWDRALLHLKRTAPPVPYRAPVPLGVGILVAPPLIFVDFDDLLDAKGEAPTWAMDFIERARRIGAFVERSSSGTGLHVFLRATPELQLKRNRYTRAHPTSTPVGIELYQRERFAALTGVLPTDWAPAPPNLNDPQEGDKLLQSFIGDLDAHAAPILTPLLPPAPLSVPKPTQPVIDAIPRCLTEAIKYAFREPENAFAAWQKRRRDTSQDDSLSAWRFSLYLEASRQSPVSPLPVYELFNPQLEPAHPGIPDWQEFSHYNAKPHRKYADIQRAHALVVEEMRLLALDMGQPAPEPEPDQPPPAPAPVEADPSWAQLGLVLDKKGRPLATSINFMRVLSRHPHFARHKFERNQLDGSTLLNRQILQDTDVTRLLEPMRAILAMVKDPPNQAVRDAVEVIADDNPFDPLKEYLDGLPLHSLDKPSLLSDWLEKVGATPSRDVKRYARRIILGLVARALKPGVKFDYVPVFEGPQGIGKSTLVKVLVGAPHYATLFGGLHSKDTLMTLRGRWAIELAELAAFKKTDNETLKSFFSTDTDVFRPPYGRSMVTLPRRCVLFGTVNEAQYLTDHTGARRFLPIHFAGAIDIKWFLENRDALFAEALYHYRRGETFHDTFEEINDPQRQAELQARMVTPAWQVRLLNHLQKLPIPCLSDGDKPAWAGVITPDYVAKLQDHLNLPGSIQHMHSSHIATFIRRAGYVKLILNYRPAGENVSPTKLHAWAHPALARLKGEEQRAFLSTFPELFVGDKAPPSWLALQETHLQSALDFLKTAPPITPVDFGGDTD